MRHALRASLLLCSLAGAAAGGGCAGRAGAVRSTVRVDPHHGKEWEDGMAALGNVLAPKSPLPVAEKAEHLRALTSYGTLIDLLGTSGR